MNFSATDETPIDVAGLCSNFNVSFNGSNGWQSVQVMLNFWQKKQKQSEANGSLISQKGDVTTEKMLPKNPSASGS